MFSIQHLGCGMWSHRNQLESVNSVLDMLLLLLLLPLITAYSVELQGRGKCKLSQQFVPGESFVRLVDEGGRRCSGNVRLPVCQGFCKTSESGVHTFPQRVANSSACVLVQTGYTEEPLTDCDAGADNSIRTVKVPTGQKCGCKAFPLD